MYGTIGPGLISFLRGFMLVCSHHRVGKFISDPGPIIYKIWLDVSHVPRHLARGSQVSVVFSCEYVNAELEVLLQTTSKFEKLNVFFVRTTPRGSVSNVSPWFYVNM